MGNSIELRRSIVRKIMVDTALSEEVVEDIINHQFEGVVEAMETHGVETIEVTGIGNFIFLPKKASKRLKFLNEFIEERKRKGAFDKRFKSSLLSREHIMKKLYGCKKDL